MLQSRILRQVARAAGKLSYATAPRPTLSSPREAFCRVCTASSTFASSAAENSGSLDSLDGTNQLSTPTSSVHVQVPGPTNSLGKKVADHGIEATRTQGKRQIFKSLMEAGKYEAAVQELGNWLREPHFQVRLRVARRTYRTFLEHIVLFMARDGEETMCLNALSCFYRDHGLMPGTLVICTLAKSIDLACTDDLLDYLCHTRGRGRFNSYATLIARHLRAGQAEKAADIFRVYTELQRPPLPHYAWFIQACVAINDLDACSYYFRDMTSRRLIPHTAIYNILMKNAMDRGNVEVACDLYENMRAANRHPTSYTLSIFLTGFLRARRYDKANEWMERIAADGAPVNAVVLTNKLQMMFQTHTVAEVLEVFADEFDASFFQNRGFVSFYKSRGTREPTLWTLGLIIYKILQAASGPEQIWSFYSQLQQSADQDTRAKGLLSTTEIHTMFLHALGSYPRSFSKTIQVLECMQQYRCTPNLITYTELLEQLSRLPDAQAAEALWNRMRLQGIHPNVLTWTSYLKSYVASRDVQGAKKKYRDMIASGIVPNEHTIAVMSSCTDP